jgi:nucleoside-diphosphate-sugar epimerase
MKILITGAGGFIGSQLSSHLEKSHVVFRILRHDLDENNSRVFSLDLADVQVVRKKIKESRILNIDFDVIIHCAAVLANVSNTSEIELFNQNNRITESLLEIAQKINVKKIINFSTIGVYPNKDGNFSETSQINPAYNSECLYSLSKFCSEELLAFLLPQTKVVNLRLAQTYGVGMRQDRIYSMFVNELNEKNTITLWGNGERTSNFISIEHLILQIDRILNNDSIQGTFNFGQKNISYKELAEQIINRYGNAESKILMLDKGVKSKVVIDCSKLENEINNEK